MYCRECPKCSKKITYSSKYSYFRANKKNSVCSECIQQSRRSRKEVECATCKKFFYKQPNQVKERNYCSRICADKGHSLFLTKHEYRIVKCLTCEKEFKQLPHRKKFCSTSCNSKHNLKTINSKEPKKKDTLPELLFKNMLEANNISYVYQKSIIWKKGWKKWYDFYLPDSNLLIEIDGTYWHGKNILTKDLNKQQWNTRVNDRLKNLLAKKRGFRLVRIWSDEITSINLKKII